MNWIKEILIIEKPELPKKWQPLFALLMMSLGLTYRFWRHGTVAPLVFLTAFWLVFLLRPRWWSLFLQFLLWTVLGLFNVVALVGLTAAFYISFSTMGLWKRRAGWNPMRQGFVSELASFREPAEELKSGHFTKPF